MDPKTTHHKLAITVLILAVVFGVLFYVVNTAQWGSSQQATVPQVAPAVKAYPIVSSNSSNSSKDQYAYITKITQASVPAMTIDITGCTTTPSNTSVKMGSSITFTNKDKVSHGIWFSQSANFVISPQSSFKETFDFMKFPGIYYYRCDNIEKAGVVYITNAK